jgi:hypothetical protein
VTALEKRADLRAPVSLVAAIQTNGDESPVVVLDLSPGGVCLQVDAPPDPHLEYRLHLNVHRTTYTPRFRVVRWVGEDGVYHWGCSFSDLGREEQEHLRRSVHAAAGVLNGAVRDWAGVSAEAAARPGEQIVVGTTPAGDDIRLLGQDCLDIGEEGLKLYVETIIGLERA